MAGEISLQRLNSEEKPQACPDCGSTQITNGGEEMYCEKCGYLFE